MTKRFTRGFTLIELLVVIAIIGILSAVVLASLNDARQKGADAAVKSNLNNIRAQAELVMDLTVNNSYAGVCGNGPVNKMVNAAGGTCDSAFGGWAVEAPLKAGGFWCVDYKGTAKSSGTSKGTATTCP